MISRIFLTLLGSVLLLWGVGMPLVTGFGTEAAGTITHVRRQLGDRGEAIPNRYAFAIAYEFRLSDGRTAQGYTQRVGDYFSPRNLAVGQAVRVHYLPGFPWVSNIDSQGAANWEHFTIAAVGGGLVFLAMRPAGTQRKPKRSRQTHKRNRANSAHAKPLPDKGPDQNPH